ncbi:MAG TPA: carboxypeptidase regulatory-like domain-containing protein, partial [candidate division Zixibacteria bacterium]|nr:carboxypeptidase regulatory-like domain-containing protein [candidate division Zixibacteria bacterium]
ETPGDNSDGTGFYDVVVPTGLYDIRYRPVNGEQLIPVEFRDVNIYIDTTIDVTMLPSLTLSGVVTGPGAVPVSGADLDVFDFITGDKLNTPNDNTDGAGAYSIVVPPGTYDVDVDPPPGSGLAPTIVRNIVVSSNQTQNFQLEIGATLNGTVKDPLSQGVIDVDIDITDESTGADVYLITDKTDASGNYSLQAPLGTFTVDYQPPVVTGLAPQRIINYSFTGNQTLNINLVAGVNLTGVISNAFAAPVAGADIDATDANTGIDVPLVADFSDAGGAFATVVAPGLYNLEFEAPPARRLAPRKLYGVSVGMDTSLSISLDTGMVVSGIVRDTDNTLFDSVALRAYNNPGGDSVFLPGNQTNPSGAYSVLLAPGTYDLVFKPHPAMGRADSVILAGVTIGKDTTIDVTFSSGGPLLYTISGTVSNQVFTPSQNVDITLRDGGGVPLQTFVDATDALGHYSIPNVAAGSYQLTFDPEPADGLFSKTITGVTVVANTEVNAILDAQNLHTISGLVTDQSLAPVANVDITLLSDVGSPLQTFVDATDAGGAYALTNIPADTYWLLFSPSPATGLSAKIITNVVVAGNTQVDVTLDPCAGSCGCCVKAGDADNSGTTNIGDVTFLIAYIFSGGSAPVCNDQADASGDNKTNIGDATYLITFIFSAGASPVCGTTGS